MNGELQELMQSNPEWYKDLQYKDVKIYIKDNINSASRSFVAIGYYLKYVRDNELYSEDGYATIWEFAQGEFSIGKSSASSFMSINDKFSKDGNSPILLEQYKDFTSSKLAEMLTMSNEQLEQVTPSTTIVEIRQIKKPEKEETVLTSEQTEIEKPSGKCIHQPEYPCTLPEASKLAIGDGMDCNAKCCWGCKNHKQCGYECNSSSHRPVEQPQEQLPLKSAEILGLIMSQPEAHLVFLNKKLGESIEAVGVKAAIKDFMTFHSNRGQKLKTKDGQHEYEHMFHGEYGKPFETVELRWDKSRTLIPADDFMEMYLKYVEFSDASEPDPAETLEADIIQTEPSELPEPLHSAEYHLREEIKKQKEVIETMKDYWKQNQPDTLLKYETILLAYKCLLTDMEYPNPEPVEKAMPEIKQPELPILRNNDQRKDFIDTYETWPIWIDQELTGERYYRYNLSDKVAMVVKVSRKHSYQGYKETKDYEYGSEQYYLLGVKTEWHSGKTEVIEDDTRTFYECSTNKSALVDYLKEIQKKGV